MTFSRKPTPQRRPRRRPTTSEFGKSLHSSSPSTEGLPSDARARLQEYTRRENAARQRTERLTTQGYPPREKGQEFQSKDWYAITWIATNGFLSFVANLYLFHRLLGIDPIVSGLIGAALVMAPAFALSVSRQMWRFIRLPGNWIKDVLLAILWGLFMLPLLINWGATTFLFGTILVFEHSVGLMVIYFLLAVGSDMPQFFYFLFHRNREQ